jgi:hypothetical protein
MIPSPKVKAFPLFFGVSAREDPHLTCLAAVAPGTIQSTNEAFKLSICDIWDLIHQTTYDLDIATLPMMGEEI